LSHSIKKTSRPTSNPVQPNPTRESIQPMNKFGWYVCWMQRGFNYSTAIPESVKPELDLNKQRCMKHFCYKLAEHRPTVP